MLESYSLKQQYLRIRQELSQALYQNDAANRVIARLIKERDAARDALTEQKPTSNHHHGKQQNQSDEMEVEKPAPAVNLPEECEMRVNSVAEELSQQRRKRQSPEGLVSQSDLASFKASDSVESGQSSLLAMSVCPFNEKRLALASSDKTCIVYDTESSKTMATLKGHTKAVNAVAWVGTDDDSDQLILTGSADKSIKAFAPSARSWKASFTLKEHAGEVTSLSVHPSNDYFAACSTEGLWSFNDLKQGKSIISKSEEDTSYSAISFHPDGLILATGTSNDHGTVKIWDVKTQSVAFTCPDSHQGHITSLAFSENGYYFATASSQSPTVKIWDLRKLARVHEINVPEASQVVRVQFDQSGQYLGVASEKAVRVYLNKKWTELVHLTSTHSGDISDLTFCNRQASVLSTIGSDGTLVYYSQ